MPVSMTTLAPIQRLRLLRELERKVLWLSAWTIHHANHLRPNRDGLKVGGHQASCASLATVMAALYFSVLRPEDRVAVKPHASPVFHAIQYLFGRQSRDKLERFRGYGGAQSYPSRTKDADDVDFSTGSVGLGVAMEFAQARLTTLRMGDLRDALEFLAFVRIQHQARQIFQERKPDNFLHPVEISNFERTQLRDAFQVVQTLQSVLSTRYKF